MESKIFARWRYFVVAGIIVSPLVLYVVFFVNVDISNISTQVWLPLQNRYLSSNAITEGNETIPTISGQQIDIDISALRPDSEVLTTEVENTPTDSIEKTTTLSELMIFTTEMSATSPANSSSTKVEIVTSLDGKSTFSKMFEFLDWKLYESAVAAKNKTQIQTSQEDIILQLSNFITMEPIVPINSTCTAFPLGPPEQVDCSKYPTGFTGHRTNRTIKIGVLVQFGFDVDVLEIYLNEMFDIVDQFFIIESTKTHSRTMLKPLMWEKVQFQPRFLKFVSKITHFIIDDAQSADARTRVEADTSGKTTMWLMESLQERLRWLKFLEWNNARKVFSEDDVLGFGDADEIPSRKMVNMIKYCELKDGMVDFGIWFPFGNIKYAFQTDHPIRGHPYTLGEPGFWTLRAANEFSNGPRKGVPSRTHGTAKNFLLGGMHMTHYGYLPFQLVKRVTATEGGPLAKGQINAISTKVTVGDIQKLELELAASPANLRHRITNLTQISIKMKDIAILPWFYDCNRDRYPIWEGRHDTRLYLPIPS